MFSCHHFLYLKRREVEDVTPEFVLTNLVVSLERVHKCLGFESKSTTIMRLIFYQYILPAITAQIVCAAEQSASRVTTRDAITDTAAASSIFTLRDEGSESESISGILTRALKADTVETRSINGTASYDEVLGVPRCGSVGTSCDTGNLIIGRGHIHPEPNYPNTLGTTCFDGTSGGPTDESVDRIIVSSEPGNYLMEEGTASITATVNCWAGGYTKDYVAKCMVSLPKNRQNVCSQPPRGKTTLFMGLKCSSR